MAQIENLQALIRYELCTSYENPTEWDNEKGKVKFTIEDKTQPLATAHIFHTGYVDYNEDPQIMSNQAYEGYCEWLLNNKVTITEYFKNKE